MQEQMKLACAEIHVKLALVARLCVHLATQTFYIEGIGRGTVRDVQVDVLQQSEGHDPQTIPRSAGRSDTFLSFLSDSLGKQSRKLDFYRKIL